jgi:hypothetical protein
MEVAVNTVESETAQGVERLGAWSFEMLLVVAEVRWCGGKLVCMR